MDRSGEWIAEVRIAEAGESLRWVDRCNKWLAEVRIAEAGGSLR